MADDALAHLARSRGLGEAYHDYRGELRYFSERTRRAVLAAMGCDVSDTATMEREIAAMERERWRPGVAAVTVLAPPRRAVRIVIPSDAAQRQLHWTLTLADGRCLRGEVQPDSLPETASRELDGRWHTQRELELPELPVGDHRLNISMTALSFADGRVVMPPPACYEPPAIGAGLRSWGIAVQLYTLRSPTNWGIGDFADLRSCIRLAAGQGADFIGLNPLHALFSANPAHFSPYSPSSRRFLNVLYISVPDVAEFASCGAARAIVDSSAGAAELKWLRRIERVDYKAVTSFKLRVLRELYIEFEKLHLRTDSIRARDFQAFRAEQGENLQLHALHEAIDLHVRATDPKCWGWPVWPKDLRDPHGTSVRDFGKRHAAEVDFHAWLQWLADGQLRDSSALAREAGMTLGLYGDYAVGVNPAGSETWAEQRVYRMGAGIGAPPDALALKGQDWGIPPQDPLALAVDAYRPFRSLLAANMRHFGALRIDHVMALFRQWWVPRGLSPNEGGYVHYPLDDLMSVLALESHQHECLVIGEDLGTVPDEVRAAMTRYGVYRYKVLLFEKEHDGRFRSPAAYERRAIASVTTHDLPTLRGFWEGRDLALRDRLQLYPNDEIRAHVLAERARDRVALLEALNAVGLAPEESPAEPAYADALSRAVQQYLASTASALAVVQLEDLIGVEDPVNVPGTQDEYPNWQRKLPLELETIFGREDVKAVLAAVIRGRALAPVSAG
jgi:4-alpha-glucanotransferase